MPRTYDDEDVRRARIGALIIVICAVVALGVFFIDAIVRATTEGPRITIAVDAAPGVDAGTDVWVAGRSVGRVLGVQFRRPDEAGERVVIRAVLERGVEEFIRDDADVSIQPGALLAPVIVLVHPGSPDAGPRALDRPFTARDRALGPEALLELGEALRVAGDSLRVQTGRVSTRLSDGGGTLGALLADRDVLAESEQALRETMVALGDWRSGSIGRLASDSVLGPRLDRISSGLATLDSMQTRERTSETLRETTAAVDAFQERLALLAARLDAGEGTAGRALRDGELARQVALLRARLDSAAVEFALYPERWLRVKVF
ncbi:MAG: MlaD family protein [Gemmatimonadota bacterium]|nr:MlaD family protein [Gemmatimonadota bacterium]